MAADSCSFICQQFTVVHFRNHLFRSDREEASFSNESDDSSFSRIPPKKASLVPAVTEPSNLSSSRSHRVKNNPPYSRIATNLVKSMNRQMRIFLLAGSEKSRLIHSSGCFSRGESTISIW